MRIVSRVSVELSRRYVVWPSRRRSPLSRSVGNGNQHDHDPLPVLVAGGASGQLKGDRHLAFPAHTPMSNLMLSLLDKMGVHQDRFGDSNGKLEV